MDNIHGYIEKRKSGLGQAGRIRDNLDAVKARDDTGLRVYLLGKEVHIECDPVYRKLKSLEKEMLKEWNTESGFRARCAALRSIGRIRNRSMDASEYAELLASPAEEIMSYYENC